MRKLDMRNILLETLSKAQEERRQRQQLVRVDGYSQPAWILFERETMLDATNRERAILGKDPVSEKDVLRVEKNADGHSDYSYKYALGCAELVLDRP